MTRPRPTDAQIGVTLQQLYRIATRQGDAYHLLADLIALYDWLLTETAASEDGRGFGHGATDTHLHATANAGDLEGRLHDPLLREQRRVNRRWLATLRETGHRWHDDATNITRFATQPWTG